MLFKKLFVSFILFSMAISSFADELKAFQIEAGEQFEQDKLCKPYNLKLPSDYVVLATGAYSGRRLGFKGNKNTSEVSQIDVAVNYTDVPVVLMLGAYESVIWNVGWTKKTKIAAVVLTGYYGQKIAGLEKSVPVMLSTNENKNACGYFYQAAESANIINKISFQLFDKDVNMIYPVTKGKVAMGKKITKETVLTSADNTPERYYQTTETLRGAAAVNYLLVNNFVRYATVEELLKMSSDISKLFLTKEDAYLVDVDKDKPKTASIYRFNKMAFIVQKPFDCPLGMDEGGVRLFITPKGVQYPGGVCIAINVDENPSPERRENPSEARASEHKFSPNKPSQ